MTRICTGDVWVRSTTLPGSPYSTNSVSHMLRAGWSGGMFRAAKLYQSVSTSGPSAMVKPSPTNTSSSRSCVWVTRWVWPRAGPARELGEVEALGGQARCGDRRRRARPGAASSSCLDLGQRPFTACPAVRAVGGVERAEALLERGECAPLAEQLGVERAELVEGGRGADAPAGVGTGRGSTSSIIGASVRGASMEVLP